MSSDLSLLNYLNVLAYLCNAGVTYTIGANVEASIKYQTLVTPVGFAFSIWGVIFISQLIFVIVQLLPTYRMSPLVTDAIGYKYIWVCLAQAAWCPTFSIFELTWLALAFMIMILVFLILIVRDQYKLQQDSSVSYRDNALLQFPFSLHCGWIAAASLVSINVVLVASHVGSTGQYVAAVISLVIVVVTAAFCVGYLTSPRYVIPSVLAWATFGIYTELGNPKDLIVTTFDDSHIQSIRYGALATCVFIVVGMILKIGLSLLDTNRCCQQNPLEVEEPLLNSAHE